jgi:two-component system NtrC family sensor kinase
MYDLTNFTQTDLVSCGDKLRGWVSGASSMEEAANILVKNLYENITDSATGQTTQALVRFYKTHPYDQLDTELQDFAQGGLLGSAPPSDDLRCLCLLGTVGDIMEANSRAYSKIHQAIPLANAEVVLAIPIIGSLINQFGIDVATVMRPDPMLTGDLSRKPFNTFYVPEAVGSPDMAALKASIPSSTAEILKGMATYANEFVVQYNIKSLLAFGGVLSSGELFFVLMMSKVTIPSSTAEIFKGMARYVKDAMEPFVGNKIYA